MTLLRTWIVSVTACAMVIAAAEALMPDGAVKRVGKLTGGLILVLGLLQPLVKLDYADWLDALPAQTAGAVTQEDLKGAAYAPMKSIIERELSAYIVDKGAQLGVTCTAQVVCETGEDGGAHPHPDHHHRGHDPGAEGGDDPLCHPGARHPPVGANLPE